MADSVVNLLHYLSVMKMRGSLAVYDLRIYDRSIYDLSIYHLSIYDLSIYHLSIYDLDISLIIHNWRLSYAFSIW